MTRVAAIDCGTNSIRLLVADVADGQLTDLVREMRVVRLGQGVDRTGEFAEEALVRTFAALDDYAATCRELGVERVRFVATSATRDARNRERFLEGVRERIGVTPEVISGHEEASLSFNGVVSAVMGAPAPFLVVDLGGGSTELALGGDTLDAAYSMDVGCVRLTERHLTANPPTAQQQADAVADVREALAVAREQFRSARRAPSLVSRARSPRSPPMLLTFPRTTPSPSMARPSRSSRSSTHAMRSSRPPMRTGPPCPSCTRVASRRSVRAPWCGERS